MTGGTSRSPLEVSQVLPLEQSRNDGWSGSRANVAKAGYSSPNAVSVVVVFVR